MALVSIDGGLEEDSYIIKDGLIIGAALIIVTGITTTYKETQDMEEEILG
jgi:hypothetical protein